MSTLTVTGTINEANEFRPSWWATAPGVVDSITPTSSDWSVAVLDADGVVLSHAAAAVEVVACGVEEATRFDAALLLPETSAAVVIRHGDREVYRREVPPSADVSLVLGDAGPAVPARETLSVPVHVSGGFGPGAHLIATWESPARALAPLGLIALDAGAAPVVTVDLGALPGGHGCRLRVAYNDGVRTTSVVSQPLDVPARPAAPVIETPTTSHRMCENGWLSLRGRIDGDGDPHSLEWLLDGVPIGRGARTGHARPGVGRHELMLRHGDQTATVDVTVVAAPPLGEPAPWQPPWRIGPAWIRGTASAPRDFGSDG